MNQGGEHRETRRMMETAIRRLNVLEFIILGAVVVLALIAGALLAWLLESTIGVSFRMVWGVASVLFFVVPGVLVHRQSLSTDDAGQNRANLSSHTTTRNDG